MLFRSSAYPLIYDGQYTLKGVAYGTVNGSFTDKVYETIAGRNRFTTVLVGMAPNAYKENLIFRGYCILMKNGKEYIIYGPPVGRNLYQLAEQVLSLGTYEDGSPQKEYLEKVISDADAIGKTFH